MKIEKKQIHLFAEKLDSIHYDMLIRMMIGVNVYENPFTNFQQLKTDIKKFDEDTQKLIAFFYMGEFCEKDRICSLLGDELLEYLYESDILNYDHDSCWLNNCLIIPFLNCYFVVSNTTNYPTCQENVPRPYIGPDSYWLARNVINKVKGDVLDLCTGSGIQAILAAKGADKVLAVDIDEVALSVAAFNAVLNRVEDKVTFVKGNLYEVVGDNRFDYILTNPPFIPIPGEISFPICGDGGENGKVIVDILLAGYKMHLKEKGTAIMIGQALGDNKRTFLEDDINEICQGMQASLMLWGNIPIASLVGQTMMLAKVCNNSFDLPFDEWENRFLKQGATELYTFTLFITNTEGSLKTVYSRLSWNKEDIPAVNIQKVEKIGNYYSMHFSGNRVYSGPDDQKFFLEMIDGKKTVSEILAEFPLKYKVKYNSSEWEMIASYLSFCGLLERKGIIKKRRDV